MSALLFALAFFSAAASGPIQIGGDPLPVTVKRIEQFEITGTSTRFGKLEFRGGLVVSSKERKFGGISGIHIENDGGTAILVSDLGYILHADFAYQNGRLSSVSIPAMMRAPLPAAIRRKDLEDIAVAADGLLMLALERNSHQIAAIDLRSGKAVTQDLIRLPGAAEKLGFNWGIESLAFFPEGTRYAGSMIAIGERPDKDARSQIPCWIVGSGTCAIKARGKYDITSARFLSNGDQIILERRFTPDLNIGMRLRRIRQADIGVGTIMDGEILMEANLAMQIDNMEGLAIHRDPSSGTNILTILSDDNLNFFQRTLILQFALSE